MSDDHDRRLRRALRDGVPKPPTVPAYGSHVAALARRRRTAWRGGVVGGAAFAAAAVVAVMATTMGGPAATDGEPPVASVQRSSEASVSCDDVATEEGLRSDVTAVRLCIAVPDVNGGAPRVPGDLLVGAGAAEFVQAILRLPTLPPDAYSCPRDSGPAYRFMFAYADGSRGSAELKAHGCRFLEISGENRVRAVGDTLATYLKLVHDQRTSTGVPAETSTPSPSSLSCPARSDRWGSTLGAEMPSPSEEGLTAVVCRYDRATSKLLRSSGFGDGAVADELVTLSDGSRHDPCTAIRVRPPRYDDRVLLADAYGDVVVATAFFCTPYEVDGQSIWPDQRLQGLVDRLLRARTRG